MRWRIWRRIYTCHDMKSRLQEVANVKKFERNRDLMAKFLEFCEKRKMQTSALDLSLIHI